MASHLVGALIDKRHILHLALAIHVYPFTFISILVHEIVSSIFWKQGHKITIEVHFRLFKKLPPPYYTFTLETSIVTIQNPIHLHIYCKFLDDLSSLM